MGHSFIAKAAAIAAPGLALVPGGCTHLPAPLPEGRYCARQQLVGDTGGGTFPLGEFWMIVDVEERDGRRQVSFANHMPDNQEVLLAELAPASPMPDGSLRFEFEDAWGNHGEGRLKPDGRIALQVLRPSPEGGTNITRNYGSYRVSRAACTAADLQQRFRGR